MRRILTLKCPSSLSPPTVPSPPTIVLSSQRPDTALNYSPPELDILESLQGRYLDYYAVDVWGLGCVLLELLHGRTIFTAETPLEHLTQIECCLGSLPPHLFEFFIAKGIDPAQSNDADAARRVLRVPTIEVSPAPTVSRTTPLM